MKNILLKCSLTILYSVLCFGFFTDAMNNLHDVGGLADLPVFNDRWYDRATISFMGTMSMCLKHNLFF